MCLSRFRWPTLILGIAVCLLPRANSAACAAPPDVAALYARIADLENRLSEAERALDDLKHGTGVPSTQPITQLGPIAPHDLLRISVEELASAGVTTVLEQRVQDDGKIGVPLLGAVSVGGLTVGKAEETIARLFRDRSFIPNAGITVERAQAGADNVVRTGPLATGDFLRVRVLELLGPGRESVKNVQVDERGEVHPPHLKGVKVAGLTEAAAADAITRAYAEAQLVQNAPVSVLRTGPMAAASK